MADQDASPVENEHPPLADTDRDATNDYAFLVHSNRTLTKDLPPKVNKIFVRQRRRRTSPEDYAILEAEYQQNPKPDKATRAHIVSKVSLGDKEVQIWFQNRRQNDRRRSKPLQPHELLPSDMALTNTAHVTPRESDERSTQPQADPFTSSITQLGPETSFESRDGDQDKATSSQLSSSQTTTISSSQTESLEDGEFAVGLTRTSSTSALDPPQHSGGKRKRGGPNLTGPTGPTEPKYSRRSLPSTFGTPPSLRISLSFDGEAMVRKEGEKTPSPPKPRDALRISFAAGGEAIVRTASEPSPSPSKRRSSMFRAREARFSTLRRSTSAIPFGMSNGTPASKDPKIFGRSRDARTWELYCDDDARSALSTSFNGAGGETSRSHDASNATSRRYSQPRRSGPLAPRTNLPNEILAPKQSQEKRSKLTRTVSSLARLESDPRLTTASITGGAVEKYSKELNVFKDSGDSDKENWIPGTRTSNTQRPRPRKNDIRAGGRRVLGRSGQQLSANRRTVAKHKRLKVSRATGKENDTTFERREGGKAAQSVKGAGPNQEEDFDCVQGLLSLSQGAWR